MSQKKVRFTDEKRLVGEKKLNKEEVKDKRQISKSPNRYKQ